MNYGEKVCNFLSKILFILQTAISGGLIFWSNKNGDRINLFWEKVTAIPNCEVTSYELYWFGDILWSDDFDNGTDTVDSTTLVYTLTNTVPHTNYTICVAAKVDNELEGGESCEYEQTEQKSNYTF